VVTRGDGRFLGHGQVGGPRADDEHEAFAGALALPVDRYGPRAGPVDRARDLGDEPGGSFRARARDEELPVMLEDRLRDLDELVGRLAFAVDDLGVPAAHLALRVEPRVAEVVHGPAPQALETVLDAHAAGADVLEEALDPGLVQSRGIVAGAEPTQRGAASNSQLEVRPARSKWNPRPAIIAALSVQ
jgi:hypothetical protein